MDDEAVTVSGTGPEDPVVILGSGILGKAGSERSTGRYGTVHLTVLDSIPGEPAPARTVSVPPDEDLRARILHELAKADAGYADAATAASEAAASRPDTRVVAFDQAPLGTTGSLVAHVIHADVTEDDREFGKRHPGLRPPEPGERVALGSGVLFTEKYGEGPLIGVRPADGRAEDWMDSAAIFRCEGHLVRLEFEISKDSAPGVAAARRVQAARQESGLPRSAARTDQVGFPVANPLVPPGQAASESGRRPCATRTVAAAGALQKRGR